MLSQSEFKLTLAHVRRRLDQLLDHHFHQLAVKQKNQTKKILVLNESLLEQWSDLLGAMLYWKDPKRVPTKPVKTVGRLKPEYEIKQVYHLPAHKSLPDGNNFLLDIQMSHIDVFQINEKIEKNMQKFAVQKTRLEFGKGILHKFCTYTCCDAQNVVLVGGCRHSDPNLKSHEVLHLNLVSKEIVKIGELPYGVSSHGTIKIGSKLYIAGGNKHHNIVSKKCVQFDLESKKATLISDLNYPSASHSLLNWNQQFVYKFGGVGSCFGEWDLSPYIQRYSIDLNQWEVINPTIKINENLLHHYSLLVSSLTYITPDNSIVILGGFDFHQRGSNKMFQIAVRDKEIEEDNENSHEIVALGDLQPMKPGGFSSQEVAVIGSNLFALQAIDTEKGLELRVLRVGKEISYI